MKQVVIRPDGVAVEEVPPPILAPGQLLVRTAFSCISPGTELTGAVRAAEPVWRKALREPARTIDKAKDLAGAGLGEAARQLRARSARLRPTGYSASGTVLATGEGVFDIDVGDRVACAGAGYANHAEILAVPRNLVARVPEAVTLEAAATVTLGAIALHGVRRAEPTLGETFVVVGLGAVGQLVAQLLRANGCRVIGVDVDPIRLALARSLGADATLDPTPSDHEQAAQVHLHSAGRGADGVVVTAASSSSEIMASAFRMCRPKGRVVLVGDVGLQLNREDLYGHELEFRISTSTGPGRYDERYEEDGVDYPIGYVRWTENRNMEAILDLLATSRLNVTSLMAGPWDMADAAAAYASLTEEPRPLLVLLRGSPEGDGAQPAPTPTPAPRPQVRRARASVAGPLRIAVIGTGSFCRAVHLPNLAAHPQFALRTVVAQHGTSALEAKRAFGAELATTEVNDVLDDPAVDAVLIATRHHLHAELTLRALEAGKHVLVEKPPALTRGELEQLRDWFTRHEDGPVLLTGFNRRFAPLVVSLRRWLQKRVGPVMLDYQMNTGFLERTHWVHGPQGGGRNLGEACHIYDLFRHLAGCEPVRITATALRPAQGPFRADDNFVTTLSFADGSIAVLTYTSMGAPDHPKERLTAHVDGRTAVLHDYRSLDTGATAGATTLRRQDKGHRHELTAFAEAAGGRAPWPIPLEEQLGAVEVALVVDGFLPGRAARGEF